MHRLGGALLVMALALTAPWGAEAQQLTLPPVPIDTFTLDNGLHVMVSEDHSAPVVAVVMWYGVGSAHEEEGRSGFAHLFEHMLFEETENLADGDLQRLVTQAGGNYNGTTDSDRTAYFEVLPSNRVNLSFWLHAERMARLAVTDRGFETQREVVKEERRLRIDNQPYGSAQLTIDTLASDYEPYKHTVIGSMDDLNAAATADVRAFYERYYVPNNATLAVVGDVTVDQIRTMAQEFFGDIPRGPAVAALPPVPESPRTDGERRITLDDPLAQLPLMFMAYNIPPAEADDMYALSLLSTVFSAGESSRLYRRLVKEEQAAPTVISFLVRRQGPGMLTFGSLPNQGGSIDDIEALILEEIEELRREGITARELEKAKNQRRSSEVTSRLTVLAKANNLQWYNLHFGDPFRVNGDMSKYEAVTVEDIRRVAEKYLTDENRTVVVAQPSRPVGD